MKTERLTEWIYGVDERHAIPRMDLRANGHSRCIQKLAELEDLQEQGRLVIVGEQEETK